MIPNNIHHIWLQGGVPEKYQENYDKWETYLVGWEHHVWSEEELLSLCTDQQVEKYMKIETLINRVNYLKYILLYNEGGIFADLDSYPIKNLDDFFNQTELKDIDVESKLSIRYPFNTEIPNNWKIPPRKFKEYDIIIPGRKTMMFYPNGDKPILLDNPVLMSQQKELFWLNLLKWCEKRTNLKSGALAEMEFLPHEPYGPYGITDFVFQNFDNPYNYRILILPPTYFLGDGTYSSTYIIHAADQGW